METSRTNHRLLRTACLALGLVLLLAGLAPAGEKYAFLVGVRKYKNTQLKSLSYTENDITALAEVLKRTGYAADNVVSMTQTIGAEDTRFLPIAENIKAELQLLLKELTDQDSVLVAFAGHGIQFKGEAGAFFCPADADLADRKTLVSLTGVYKALDRCQADNKVLLVDACRNDPQTKLSRTTGEIELESVGRPQKIKVPGGVTALFSCSAGEEAYEHPQLKHGVFFHFVIEGLSGKADSAAGGEAADGQVSLAELEQYTVQKVQRFVRKELGRSQTPERSGETRGQVTLASLTSFDPNSPLAEPTTPQPKVGPAPFEPPAFGPPPVYQPPTFDPGKPTPSEKDKPATVPSTTEQPEPPTAQPVTLIGPPVKTSLIAYALLPEDEQQKWGAWVCSISADQTRVTVRGMKTRSGAVRGTLVDDPVDFGGKRLLTFELPAAEAEADMIDGIRIPADGNGLGQVRCNGVWTFSDPRKRPDWLLRFQTSVPQSRRPAAPAPGEGERPLPTRPSNEPPPVGDNVRRYVLEAPDDPRIRSLVLIDGEALMIGDNQGRTYAYERQSEFDSEDGAYWGYFCQEAGQYLRWPRAGMGPVMVGQFAEGAIRWRQSRMRARSAE